MIANWYNWCFAQMSKKKADLRQFREVSDNFLN
jgi:hypothetical protein